MYLYPRIEVYGNGPERSVNAVPIMFSVSMIKKYTSLHFCSGSVGITSSSSSFSFARTMSRMRALAIVSLSFCFLFLVDLLPDWILLKFPSLVLNVSTRCWAACLGLVPRTGQLLNKFVDPVIARLTLKLDGDPSAAWRNEIASFTQAQLIDAVDCSTSA